MIESRGSDFLYRTEESQKTYRNYRIEVQRGLKLGVIIAPDIPSDLRDRMVNEMTSSLVNLTEILKIPLPHIDLISHSKEASLISTSRVPNHYPLAITTITDEYPQGVLEFSPRYLDHVVGYEMGLEEERPPKPIEWLEAHEMFHLWQHRGDKQAKEMLDFHYMQFEKDGLIAWSVSPPEIAANEFANRWLERLYTL